MRHLIALLLTPLAALASEGWLTDLEAAKKQAAAEKKDILIDFTGSDWCGWCIKLDKEVFSTPEFKAQKDFVLVSLDFPHKKQLPADQKAKNEALMKQWGVQGFPTIILTNAAGQAYAETGYKDGGPVKYLAHLAELRKENTPANIAAFAEKGKQAAAQAAKRDEARRKMEAAFAAKDFDAACKVIDENFPTGQKGAAALANFNKAMISMRMDATNKDRALKFADAAIAEAEKLGDQRMIDGLKKAREQMAGDSDAAAAGK